MITRRGLLTLAAALTTTGCLHAQAEVSRTETVDGSWPTYRYDSGNTAYVPDMEGPRDGGGVLWKHPVEGDMRGGVVVHDGTAYWIDDALNEHVLYAAGASTGEVEWRFEPGITTTGATPTVAGETVYVAAGDILYAVDAETGEELWNADTGTEIASSGGPKVVDDVLHTGLAAVDARTGELLWNVETASGENGHGSPAVGDDVVLYTTNQDLYVLDPDDGSRLWSYDEGEVMDASTAVDGDAAYFAGRADGEPYFYAVDPVTGEELWSHRGRDDALFREPAVTENHVYLNTGSAVICLEKDSAEEVWRYETTDYVGGGPVVTGDVVYVNSFPPRTDVPLFGYLLNQYTSRGHTVHALDKDTGEKLWGFATDHGARGKGNVRSSPAVVDGVLYVPSALDHVYALAEPQ